MQGSSTYPDFEEASSETSLPIKKNGFYYGPFLANGFEAVKYHFENRKEKILIETVTTAADGSIKLAIHFNRDVNVPNNNLSTEVALIKNPDDWGGYAHHIIGSSQVGCAHQCRMCNDGLPQSIRGNLAAEQMAFAAYLALTRAGISKDSNLPIKLLQLGSGDPFANAEHTAALIRNIHLIRPRISSIYTSTAGAIRKMQPIIEATHVANDNGVAVEAQFSLHHMVHEERVRLIAYPRITPLDLMEAAGVFRQATKGFERNLTLINYMVVPGWNDSRDDARRLAAHMPEGCVLKLVALNPVDHLDGVTDNRGSMYVTQFRDTLHGIEQIEIPGFLRVECSQQDVLQFQHLVTRQDRGHAFKIITPIDKAMELEAGCGMVGNSVAERVARASVSPSISPIIGC